MIDDLMRPMTNAGDIVIDAVVKFNDTQLRAASERAASSVQRAFSSRNPLGTYTTDFKHFQQAIEAATSRVTAFGLTAGVFFTVKRALVGLVESTIQVEKGLTNINVILNLSTRNLKTFSEDLFKVTTQTGQTFDTAAKAAAEFSRQGLGVEQTLKRTRDALILSRMAGLDAMTAVSDLTAAMNSFSDSILDSTQLISKFIAVDQRFAVSSADIAEAIKRVGSTAQDAGIDVDKLIGIITALQETTARGGAVIGQSLKTIFTRLTSPETVGVLEDFNIKVKDLNNNLLPTFDILTNIVNKFNQLGQSDRLKIESKIGNLYQINQLKALLKDLQSGKGSTAAEAESISRGAGNEALIRNEQLNQTLSAQLNRTAQNLKLTFSKLGENILGPNLKSLLGTGNSFLEGLNDSKGVEGIGTSIGKSLLKGIGDSLLVGTTYVVFALGKIFLFQLGKISQAFRSILDFGAFTKQTALETNTALQSQASTTEKLVSAASQRLAVERETLGVIQAQNATAGKAGRISSLATRSMFPGSGSGFTGLDSNTSTLNPPIPSLAGTQGRASIMGKIGVVSRKLSDSSKLLLDPNVQNDPQMLRIINEERKISQTELGSLRNQLAVIDASQRQRNESLKDINRVKNNYVVSRFTTQRDQAAARESAGRVAGKSMSASLGALEETFVPQRGSEQFAAGQSSITALANRRLEGSKQAEARSAAIRNNLTSAAMLASFIAPMAGNLMADSFSPGTDRGSRVGGAAIRGVGNTVSMAGMGFAMGGGAPGAIVGGLVGAFSSLFGILKEMRDIMPEVNARMDMLKDSIARGEESIATLNKLGEQSEGLRSGRIKNTPENVASFKSLAKTFLSSQVGNLTAAQIDSLAGDIADGGDPEKLKKWNPLLLNPSLRRQSTANQLLAASQAFNNGTLDQKSLMSILGSTVGGPGVSGANTPTGKFLLASNQLPTEMTDQGWTTRTPGSYKGLLSFIQNKTGMTQQQYQNLNQAFQSNPDLAKLYLDFFQQSSDVSFNKIDKANFDQQNTPKWNEDPELMSILDISKIRRFGNRSLNQSDYIQSMREAAFNVKQTSRQAQLSRAELTMDPMQIAAMRGRFGQQEIAGAGTLAQSSLAIATGRNLLGSLVGIRESAKSVDAADSQKKMLGQLESSIMGLAGGTRPVGDVKEVLMRLRDSASGTDHSLKNLTTILDPISLVLDSYENDVRKLKVSTKEQADKLKINTDLAEEMATPQWQAKESLRKLTTSLDVNEVTFRLIRGSGKDLEQALQQMRHSIETNEAFSNNPEMQRMLGLEATSGYETGLRNERSRFEAMKASGFLFSDQVASGNLNQRVGDISTGDLSGKGLTGAMTGSFTDQLKYNVKDMYRELVQGAAEVGASLKSSFKDAFVTFLDGSKSASDALRSLGLSFASKLLDIAAQGTTNMLFGSLQSLGSAAYTGFTKGAMGGYVTGGSGIRDDVPAMLAEGDFVLRKSAVTKYGVGNLNRLNFASGGANITPTSPLSNFALSDENNPQNQLRMEKEANDLNALLQYTAAKQAFDSAKKQRRLGALINLGIGLGAAGISYGASQWSSGSHRGVGSGIDAPSGYGSNFQNYAASGGLMTSHGVQRLANGGSVDNVPALLMGGEFVMNRNAVSRHGVGFMHRLNRGEVPGFADGGFVGETIPNGSGRGNSDSGLNDSISRLINSNEKLRTSMEKGVSSEDLSANQGNSQPLVGSISINVYSDSQGDTKAETKTEGGTAGSEKSNSDKGAQLGQLIQATVLDVINKQSRNGGILEQNFQRKR